MFVNLIDDGMILSQCFLAVGELSFRGISIAHLVLLEVYHLVRGNHRPIRRKRLHCANIRKLDLF
jgi:hypothetical protein